MLTANEALEGSETVRDEGCSVIKASYCRWDCLQMIEEKCEDVLFLNELTVLFLVAWPKL